MMYLLLLFPLLLRLSDSYDLTGPRAVRGLERGSLTVQCHYESGWERYVKWWCRGADWSSCEILAKTTGFRWKLDQVDRVSIRDDTRNRMFTVTMRELMKKDADVYWCGIERVGTDLGVQVTVIIDPATTTVSTTTTTTTTTITTITTATTTTTTPTMFTAPVSTEDTPISPTVTSHHSNDRAVSMKLSILLPLLFALLLLLVVAASLLAWRIVKRRKTVAGTSPEQVHQPAESDLCYANLTLQRTGTAPSSSRNEGPMKPSSSAQENQVEYITMAAFPREDISYAALSLDTSDQESTYVNAGELMPYLSSRSPEELTEYSAIRKP